MLYPTSAQAIWKRCSSLALGLWHGVIFFPVSQVPLSKQSGRLRSCGALQLFLAVMSASSEGGLAYDSGQSWKCGTRSLWSYEMWTDSSFFTVEKHEIIATLARVIIHLTVKLPLCFTVCYMPFLCASVLCILQLTVWKEKEAIYQNCAFLPASSVLFLLLGWYLFHIACGHIGKCQCIKFYCLIVHKRPWEKKWLYICCDKSSISVGITIAISTVTCWFGSPTTESDVVSRRYCSKMLKALCVCFLNQ